MSDRFKLTARNEDRYNRRNPDRAGHPSDHYEEDIVMGGSVMCCACGHVVAEEGTVYGTPSAAVFGEPDLYCAECARKLNVYAVQTEIERPRRKKGGSK